jgi:hypothetical protein
MFFAEAMCLVASAPPALMPMAVRYELLWPGPNSVG